MDGLKDIAIFLLVDHVWPIAALVLLGVATAFINKIGKVAKDKWNIEIDAQLNNLLHVALDRLSDYIIARYGAQRINENIEELTSYMADQVMRTNPDVAGRFGFNRTAEGYTMLETLAREKLMTKVQDKHE